MNRLKYLAIGILAIFLTGCGPGKIVVETLNVAGGPTSNAPGSGKSIVILPFADYSRGNLESAQRRNMLVTESLTDRLIVNGFSLPIQEDVLDFLINENVIGVTKSSLAAELTNDWSETMKSEIKNYMGQIETDTAQVGMSFGTHGLNSQMVSKIGKQFKADYIVRGRILEFKTRQGTSWAPSRRGFLPVIYESIGRSVFGYVSSDAYDDFTDSSMGSTNSGDLTSGQGAVDTQGTVQVRMWVQEAVTGSVVWSNRIRVQVYPESVVADNQYDTLFDTAIDKSVTTLVDHFVAYGL